MNGFWLAVGALVPSIGVGLLFWFAIRSIVQADRRERVAMARMDAEEREAGRDRAAQEHGDRRGASHRPAPRVD